MVFLSRLALLFVVLPILEILLLVRMGQWAGVWPTLGLVVLTGFAGATLARREGIRVLVAIQTELSRGRLPGEALLNGMAVVAGGALLLAPGILTDLVGLAALLPWSRAFLLAWVRRGLQRRLEQGAIRVAFVSGFPGSAAGSWGSSPRPGEIVVEPEKLEDRARTI